MTEYITTQSHTRSHTHNKTPLNIYRSKTGVYQASFSAAKIYNELQTETREI
jgi:hypothetical protein